MGLGVRVRPLKDKNKGGRPSQTCTLGKMLLKQGGGGASVLVEQAILLGQPAEQKAMVHSCVI